MQGGPRPLRKRCPSPGFTLVELSIVIFVIAIISGIAIPRLRDLTGAELTATTRRLSNTARYLSEEAAFRSTIYALNFDLENQAWWVTRLDQASGEFQPDDSLLSRRVVLSPDIRISDVVVPAVGKISEGLVPTYFYPEGYADPTVIHLIDARDNALTIRVDPIRGFGEVYDGYKDFEALS